MIAARLFLFAFGLAYIDPSTGQTIASARITAWRKQSGGQSGSFQDLVLKGQALGLVFLEPSVRRIGIREDLEMR